MSVNLPSKNLIYDDARPLPIFFAHAMRKYKHNLALRFRNTTMTYEQLFNLYRAFAGYLRDHLGLLKGDRIAIILPECFQFVIAELAAFEIGAVCVNIDPSCSAENMEIALKDSGATTVVIADEIANNLNQVGVAHQLKHVIVTSAHDQFTFFNRFLLKNFLRVARRSPKLKLRHISFSRALKHGFALAKKSTSTRVELAADDLAVIQYNFDVLRPDSECRGVTLSHRNILANISQFREMSMGTLPGEPETTLQCFPLFHIFGLTINLLAFLADGHQVIFKKSASNIAATINAINDSKVSVLFGPSTFFHELCHHPDFQRLSTSRLKRAYSFGSPLFERARHEFQNISGVPIQACYGLTEASPLTHMQPTGSQLSRAATSRSVGLALPSTEVKILNLNHERVLPGESGELYVRGPQVMVGYWNQQSLTSDVLCDGWLRTGDIAHLDDLGFLYIEGPARDQIIVSGQQVMPREIETVLLQHQNVHDTYVTGVTDPLRGESVMAYIVPHDPTLQAGELFDHCRLHLPAHKIPSQIKMLTTLPRSRLGKIYAKDISGLS